MSVGKKVIAVRWVLKLKVNPKGKGVKHKDKLVNFFWRQWFDYDEVFSPVAIHETIRLVKALFCNRGQPQFHLNVKSNFLIGSLEEKVLIAPPRGFRLRKKKSGIQAAHSLVWLETNTKGLKQKNWQFFIEIVFRKWTSEHGVYVKGKKGESLLIIFLYVDGLIILEVIRKRFTIQN